MRVQSLLKSIGDYGCLALCYTVAVYSANDEYFNPERISCKVKLINDVIRGIEDGILDNECFVTSAVKYLSFLDKNHKYNVVKQNLPDNDYSKLKLAAVRFDYNGHSHWVLVQDGIITFDSLDDSVCRKLGKATTARVITID